MGSGERKLLSTFSGDVAGYSRLKVAEEEASINMLAAHRDAIGIAVVTNNGRLVDFTGDNFLAEFGNAVHALSCAVEIRHSIHARYASYGRDRAVELGHNEGAVPVVHTPLIVREVPALVGRDFSYAYWTSRATVGTFQQSEANRG